MNNRKSHQMWAKCGQDVGSGPLADFLRTGAARTDSPWIPTNVEGTTSKPLASLPFKSKELINER